MAIVNIKGTNISKEIEALKEVLKQKNVVTEAELTAKKNELKSKK